MKSIEEQKKRKTKTSAAVKARYNKKHYKKFQADIKIELFDRITEYVKKEQISKSEFLEQALEKLDK